MKRVLAILAATGTLSISAWGQAPGSTSAAGTTEPSQGTAALNSDIDLGKPLLWAEPKYPTHALEGKLQGSVVLELTVGKDGTVKKAVATSGDRDLAESASRAARAWIYVPCFIHEKPVEVQTIVSINFKIDETGRPDITASWREPKRPATDEIAKLGSGVSAPKVIYAPDPEYSAKYEGVCVISLIVGSDGYPRDIKIVHSLGNELDEKAIEAVQRWRFWPARKGGTPIAVAINVEIQFPRIR